MAKSKAPPTKSKAAKELPGVFRAMDIRLPLELAPAVAALSRGARNASNTAVHMLRQIRMAYAFGKESGENLKREDAEMGEELAKSSGLCLAHFDGVLDKLQIER